MSNDIQDPGHGHSPAAWTLVIIVLVAFAIGTLFYVLDMPALVFASAGLAIVGVIIGWVMKKAGYGAYGPKYTPKAH